ncbi:TniQ family protein [Heyndrickxia sp. NPDC080065]|uniref:TniQ family protein n=1 Tax=Heyndrickxia sp. NPDC080065 TaxID=3390568 RepID=UPI003CFCB4E2
MTNKLSERSILYNLKPVGMGSKYVESLTSYLLRIAYEHNFTIGDLMKNLIAPQIKKKYLIRSATYGGNRFYEGAKTINGFMENSNDLVKVIETLTSRSDLSNLTLNKWKDFIPLRNLLKESLSWCPECIQSWQSGSKVYYPLIWYIRPVNICIEHNCYLLEECPVCEKKVDILRRQMLSGFCPNCFASLSVTASNAKPDSPELKWQKFVIQNIEDILTMDNTSPIIQSYRGQILNRLNIIYDENFSGNISNFSKFLNIPKSTLRCWLSNKKFPTTIIEMKYSTVAWILEKADDPLDNLEEGQDNIWRENMTYKSQIGKENNEERYKIGKEASGIIKDIEKMNNSVIQNVSNRHHILALVSPHKPIPEKYKGLFYGVSVGTFKLINKCLEKKQNLENGATIFKKTLQVLEKQLTVVNDTFFNINPLESCLINIGTIGEACDVPIDLYFFVISF